VGISLVREVLGTGAILGIQVLPGNYTPILFFVLPPGGFIIFALAISLNLTITSKLKPYRPDSDSGEEGNP
jgi:electron transport complex protein RnfE